jgi:hypothetical protein|tara:strand:- start:238 stop:648 length:411 start_codon:yes stop_codon:yes gene_type:complete
MAKRKRSVASRRGRNNKAKGRKKQYMAMRKLLIPEPKLQHLRAHEEGWMDGWMRVEVKAGQQVQTLWNRYMKAKEQSDTNLPDDERPFVFVAMPDGMSNGLVCVALDDVDEFVAAYGLQARGIKRTEMRDNYEEEE